MSTTYGSLVDEVLLKLSGYTIKQDRTTHLTSELSSSSLSVSLASITNMGKGVIEIDDELIWLDSFDRVASTGTIAPYGRGFNGTTAAVHPVNTRVTVAPPYPRVAVKNAINETIEAVFPTLFSTGTYTFSYNAAKTTYEVPADVQSVLYLSWKTSGSTQEWLPVKSWRHDPLANTTVFPTRNSVSIYDRIEPGRTIQVFYIKKPTSLNGSASNAVFETVTGLPSSTKDVIVLGAAYRLAAFLDTARLSYTSAEADQADTKIQYGSGASSARFLLALYNSRLTEEAKKLRDVYPSRVHYTRY